MRGWHGQAGPSLPEPGCLVTFIAAARARAGLEVLGVGTGDTEVQLRLQHALPHPLAFVAGGRAAGGPRGPVGVDAGFGGVIWKEYVTWFSWEPVEAVTGPLSPDELTRGQENPRCLPSLREPGYSGDASSHSLAFQNYSLGIPLIKI